MSQTNKLSFATINLIVAIALECAVAVPFNMKVEDTLKKA
jgi:hypothetical protein